MRSLVLLCLVLAGVILLVRQQLVHLYIRSWDSYLIPSKIQTNKSRMLSISAYLREANRRTGRYPSNDEGLGTVAEMLKQKYDLPHQRINVLGMPAGSSILSNWGEPFIYENRRGLDPTLFADSPANADRERRYSVEVDKGIYVWSLGSKQNIEMYSKYKSNVLLLWVFLWIASVVCVAVILVLVALSARRRSALLASLCAACGIGITVTVAFLMISLTRLAGPHMVTCYAPRPWPQATPELTGDYTKLVTKYHERGVLSDKAYQTMLDNLAKQPGG